MAEQHQRRDPQLAKQLCTLPVPLCSRRGPMKNLPISWRSRMLTAAACNDAGRNKSDKIRSIRCTQHPCLQHIQNAWCALQFDLEDIQNLRWARTTIHSSSCAQPPTSARSNCMSLRSANTRLLYRPVSEHCWGLWQPTAHPWVSRNVSFFCESLWHLCTGPLWDKIGHAETSKDHRLAVGGEEFSWASWTASNCALPDLHSRFWTCASVVHWSFRDSCKSLGVCLGWEMLLELMQGS